MAKKKIPKTKIQQTNPVERRDKSMADIDIEKCKLSMQVLDLLPTPVMCIDNEFNVTFMNPAGAGVMGKKPEDVIGLKCYDLFKTPHCQTPECRCAQAMKKDGVFTGETVADPGGLNLPIQYTGAPIKDADGHIVGALEYVVDFTETRKAMDEAQQKVDNLNNIPTPIMAIDKGFNVTYMNPAGAGVMGKKPEDVIGLKCYDLFKTPHCRTPECRCAQAMEKDGVFTGETVADPSGLNLPIQYTGSPVKDDDGNIIGALEYVVDIAETKKAIDDAQTKVDFLNNIPTPVMVVDKEFNVQFMNPAGAGAVGKTPEQCVGQKCYSLFNTEHCNTDDCQVAKAMKQDGVFTNDTVAKLPSGELPIRYTGCPLKDAEGNIVGGLEYVLDLTKEMEVTNGVDELVQAAIEGKLDTRADVDKFEGNYQKIVKGVNDTLDAVIGPLNVAAEYVDRISKGDIPEKITDEYKGDFNEIKNNLNQCVDAINGVTAEAAMLVEAAVEGKLDTRGDVEKFAGDYAKIVKGVNDTLDAVIGPLNVAAEYVDRISKGDIPEKITDEYKGDFNEIKNNLNQCVDAINGVTAEAAMLVEAAVEGKLDTRGDVEKFAGDYAKIVKGVNDTLDAVIGPLNVAAEYVDRISKGDIPEKITDEYKGDFNEIKNNLNQCVDAINGVTAEAAMLVEAAVEGKLDTRGDVEKFAGDYAKIVQGVNDTIGTLVGHIDQIPAPFMIIDRDFNISFMNKAGAGVIGMSQEQLIGQKCYDQFKTSDCRTANCACAKAMSSGNSETSETDAHPGGNDLFISYNGVPIRDQAGKIIGALEIVMDQTEVKKAMDDASKKVDFLNNIPTPVMVVDKDFNIQFMNPAGAQAVGRTPEACQGQKCFTLFNTEHCNTADCQVAKAMQQNGIFTNDTVAKLPSGDLPIRYTGAPLKDENDNIVGGLEYVLDLSKEMDVTHGVGELVQAAEEGRLDTRADIDKFEGNYQKIIAGINDLMEGIVVPINESMEVLGKVAERDLTKQVVGDYKGQLGEFKENINTAIKNLGEALGQATSAADQVGSASAQVASSSQALAEGSAEQAASLEETTSSLEEMSSMTKQNADNANQADNLMQEANQIVERAEGSMGDVIKSMEDISQASEETQKIIKTIDEIAFQTNLLALNAAVEAARAGEAGAGFAVVADEVRNLAMRAAEAAKNTADLIEGTVKRVNAGSDLVTKTNEAFDEVAKSAAKVGELVGEIAAASNEQAKGIEQVNQGMAEMDKVTQQNAANAEESSSASEEMTAQAQELASMLAAFKLDEQDVGHKQVTTAAPRQVTTAAPRQVTTAAPRQVTTAAPKQVTTAAPRQHQASNLKKVAQTRKKADDATDAKAATPEAVIPMDDEKTDDADFKNF